MTTLGAITAAIGSIVTSSVTWAGDFIGFITSHELVMLCVLFPFVGYGLHLVKSLIHR